MTDEPAKEVDWEARYHELVKSHRERLAGWVHDLRNSLTGIICSIEILKASSLTQEQRADAESALLSAHQANELFEQILTRARLEASEVRIIAMPFSVQELVQAVYKRQRAQAATKDIAFEFDIHAECPPQLIGDTIFIQRILMNLVSNAIKFTKDGGILIQARYDQEEGLCHIAVKDTGIGVNPDDQTRIFRMFQQSEQLLMPMASEGFGLGLFICCELASLMNGAIDLQSVPGEGSTFTVTLPLPEAQNG